MPMIVINISIYRRIIQKSYVLSRIASSALLFDPSHPAGIHFIGETVETIVKGEDSDAQGQTGSGLSHEIANMAIKHSTLLWIICG